MSNYGGGRRFSPESFWARVDKNGPLRPGMTTPCWLWTGYRDPNGYGIVSKSNKPTGTHRVAFELERGPVQEGQAVCHHCDNPTCVRPDHLFLGTQADNLHDMVAKGRNKLPATKKKRTHCARGHAFDEANTRHYRGYRVCRICSRGKSRERGSAS